MRKFLLVLTALALLVALAPRPTFATTGACAIRNGCSCSCVCTSGEGNSLKCEISKDCPCLGKSKGLFYYMTLPLRGAWSFLVDDFAAMWNALGQFTWYQIVFNAVVLLLLAQ